MNAPLLLLLLEVTSAMTLARSPAHFHQSGLASWYGQECGRTATGEKYDCHALTAAHRTLPFGTMVEVRNLANGRTVTVRINNRGPYRKGRIIDLSKGAAQQLKMLRSGTAKVELAVVK